MQTNENSGFLRKISLQKNQIMSTNKIFILLFIFLYSCNSEENQANVVIEGKVNDNVEYLTIGQDTIWVSNHQFSDTLPTKKEEYQYIKLNTWKWPRIVYLTPQQPLNFNLKNSWIASNTTINNFLLNRDSILIPYTAKWDMEETAFRAAWEKEFPINDSKIDSFFNKVDIPKELVAEVKQMELMLRAHLTSNYISFQARKGIEIDRNIYNFVKNIDLNEERLAFHVNNRNFQYYYYLDKIDKKIPDHLYPFAAIDTINKYVTIENIKSMIIKNVVKSGLYVENIDHNSLFKAYKDNVKEIQNDDEIFELYQRIQQLKPENIAPEFGHLKSLNGDSISISQLKGKNILLVAWGTWCPYCKEELPHLKRLMTTYSDQFESVAISLDTDERKWKKYILENNWKGTHLIDSGKKSIFRKNYLISGTNVYYLINKHGKIIAGNLKPSSDELEILIKELD